MLTLKVIHIFALRLLLLSCTGWFIDENPLPEGIGESLIGYNSTTSDVYLFGGFGYLDGTVCRTHIYKSNLNTVSPWTKLSTTTPSECFASIVSNSVTIQHIVYFVGVHNGTVVNNQLYLFDMTQNAFITDQNGIPNQPQYAALGCISTNNSHIYMIGGCLHCYDNNLAMVNKIQILDIKGKNWTVLSFEHLEYVSNGWDTQQCNMVSNTIYIFGGRTSNGTKIIYPDIIYKYMVLSNTWKYIGGLYPSSNGAYSVYSSKYEHIYLLNAGKNRKVSVFDIHSERIIYSNQLILNVWAAPAILYNDTIVLFGGWFLNPSLGVNPNDMTKFVQRTKLPLIPSVNTSNNSESVSTSIWILLLCIDAILFLVIGYFLGMYGIGKRCIGHATQELMKDSQGQLLYVNN